MKKIILILIILFLNTTTVGAFNCLYNCVEPYDLSNGFSRFMSGLTGSNLLAEKVAKSILNKEIKKNIQGDFTLKVNSYSVKDLKKGIFKSFKFKGKNIDIDGIKFSKLNVKTICDFNYVAQDSDKNLVFKEDLPLSFSAVLTEDDLNSTMLTDEYEKLIKKINYRANGFFSIKTSKLKIKDNKLYFILQVSLPFVKNVQDVVITSNLKVYKGDIDFAETRLVNKKISIDIKKIDKIVNYLNPLDFSLNILENKNAVLTVQNVEIKHDKIYANGMVVWLKD